MSNTSASNKTLAWILLVGGAVLLLVSVTADITGLGAAPYSFGWKQILGSVTGVIAAGAGAYLRGRI